MIAEDRPTEVECWRDFWWKLAVVWVSLPRDLQDECLAAVQVRTAAASHALLSNTTA
ncbi:hypothetical protein QEN42_00945 [Gordonia alkanivorans]|uniref:hypothetical protein n=1 Tax=Gordonia alkanivorans TaxID=84096 RepID=UPI002448FD8A|nr:hypothetical protein [Gordonia alkanivorans]MDH3048444.1 hypothetical protein [Gordonia alkanivorans]